MATSKTILMMDDDQELSQVVQAYLERAGYRVLLAGDGEEGLARARQAAPDLVVLDMLMPRLSGFAVLERLRDDGARMPVVMLTANDSSQHRAYAEFLGVDEFLGKPCPLPRLLDVVRRLCPAPVPVPVPATAS